MHDVEYMIPLTGSKLFDMVMKSTAEKLCRDFPGLSSEFVGNSIRVAGQLKDEDYQRYQDRMFGSTGKKE